MSEEKILKAKISEMQSKELNDEELENIAGGKNTENTAILKAMSEKYPLFATSISQAYRATKAQGYDDDHASGFANKMMKEVLCQLIPELDANKTFLHRGNTANVYETKEGKILTTRDIIGKLVNDF